MKGGRTKQKTHQEQVNAIKSMIKAFTSINADEWIRYHEQHPHPNLWDAVSRFKQTGEMPKNEHEENFKRFKMITQFKRRIKVAFEEMENRVLIQAWQELKAEGFCHKGTAGVNVQSALLEVVWNKGGAKACRELELPVVRQEEPESPMSEEEKKEIFQQVLSALPPQEEYTTTDFALAFSLAGLPRTKENIQQHLRNAAKNGQIEKQGGRWRFTRTEAEKILWRMVKNARREN